MNDSPILTLENVTKSFGPVTVIKGVTVNVHPGKVQVLLGENGAGKSTLIKMMAGVYQPDGGRILVDGKEVGFGIQLPNAISYGLADQAISFFGEMTLLVRQLAIVDVPNETFEEHGIAGLVIGSERPDD